MANPSVSALADILVDHLYFGIIAVDKDANVTLWNKWLERHSNLQAMDIVGRNLFEVFPDIRDRGHDKRIRDCIQKTRPSLMSPAIHGHLIALTIFKGNKTIPMKQFVKIYPLSEFPENHGAIIIIEDVTENILHQEEILRLNRLLGAIRNINQLIAKVESERELFDHSCRILVDEAQYPAAWIALANEKLDSHRDIVACAGEFDSKAALASDIESSSFLRDLTNLSIAQGKIQIAHKLPQADLTSQGRDAVDKSFFKSLCALPLKVDNAFIGYVGILSKKDHAFNGEELLLLEEVAGDISFKIRTIRDDVIRRLAEEAVKESEQKYRLLFSNVNHAVMAVNTDTYQLIEVNDCARDLFGYASEEFARMTLFELIQNAETFRQRIKTAINLGSIRIPEMSVVKKDGTVFPCEFTGGTYHWKDEKVLCAVLTDMTDQKLRQELMLRTARLESVSELAGGVAHNFNNLLQVIVGRADFGLLRFEEGDLIQVRTCLQEILDRALFGANLVKQLHYFTDSAGDKVRDGGDTVDLSNVVGESIKTMESLWQTKAGKEGSRVSFNTELTANCWVKGRKQELKDITLALIKNAIEALPAGGEIGAAVFTNGPNVVLEIQDNGIGIPGDHLTKIFDPFWTTKGPRFAGMGLTGVMGVVKRNGGDISVHSIVDQGSTFTLSLPLVEAPSEKQAPKSGTFKTGSPLTVLAVDDDPAISELMQNFLTRMSYKSFTSLSGAEAVDLFRQNPVDIVISDLGMEGMNGWELFKNLREVCKEKGLNKPIFILMTGWHGQEIEHEKMIESGLDAVIEKPVGFRKLLEILSSVSQTAN